MDATCSFSVASWDEKPYQQISGNRKLTEASVAFAKQLHHPIGTVLHIAMQAADFGVQLIGGVAVLTKFSLRFRIEGRGMEPVASVSEPVSLRQKVGWGLPLSTN